MKYTKWLAQVKELFQNEEMDYSYAAEYYSFESAYDDQMTPEKAVKDAVEWLEA